MSGQNLGSSLCNRRKDGTQRGPAFATIARKDLVRSKQAEASVQVIVNVFHDALWTSHEDLDAVQQVKQHLFKRDFAAAFSQPEFLRAYGLRWSAARASCYASIFTSIEAHLVQSVGRKSALESLQVLCIGGGAGAELVGLASWFKSFSTADQNDELCPQLASVHAHLLDIADWSEVSSKLFSSITQPRILSQFASAEAKERNKALLVPDRISYSFQQVDVLRSKTADQWVPLLKDTALITIMFTLNELYTTSLPKAQALLRTLTLHTQPGALLLIVDSPGSYSTVILKGSEKKYPMHWLLDLTLLGGPNAADSALWTKLVKDESCWFRLPEGLQYPLELEDMRYQIHLYRRLDKQIKVEGQSSSK